MAISWRYVDKRAGPECVTFKRMTFKARENLATLEIFMIVSIAWSLALAIHLIGSAYWVGASLYVSLVAKRAVNCLDPAPRAAVLLQWYGRLFRGLWHVMPATLISGWALVVHAGGFSNLPRPVNAMQGLGIVMAILFVTTARGPLRRAQRALRPSPNMFETLRRRVAQMALCGVVSLLMGALLGSL